MIKKTFLIILSLILFKWTSAQKTVPTPNASSLGVFTQFPQSSYVGQPAINLPVYNLNYDDYDLPITLNYNTNLLKPYSLPSWVGKGWSLSCGGIITRIVNDKPDDMSWSGRASYDYSQLQDMGYFYNHDFLSATNWASAARLDEASNDSRPYDKKNKPYLENNIRDYSPDQFNFSCGNISGSFFLDHTGQWKVRSEQKIKVETINTDFKYVAAGGEYPDIKRLERIKLTDGSGTVYIFGGESNSIEYDQYEKTISSWYITKIILPNKKEINFSYESGPTVVQEVPMYYYKSPDFYYTGPQGVVRSYFRSSTVFLKSITAEDQSINFGRHIEDNLTRLDVIEVTDNAAQRILKKINFNYKKETNNLSLVDVNISKDNDTLALASFDYYPGSYSSKNFDHWGYYTSTPPDASSLTNFLSSRKADYINAKIGALKTLTYPTGGYTEYIWETHNYSKVLTKEKNLPPVEKSELFQNAGGLRIGKIINHTKDQSISKTYYYVNNYEPSRYVGFVSSGVLYADPVYDYRGVNYFTYSPRIAMTDSEGSHITYSCVVEVDDDGGYVVNKFSNYDMGIGSEYLDEQRIAVASNAIDYANENKHYTSNSQERGRPLSYEYFTNTGKLIKEKRITYERLNKTNDFVRAYYMSRVPNGALYYTAEAIKIYTNSYPVSKIIDIVYDKDGLNPIETVQDFVYDVDYKKVVEDRSTDSEGRILKRMFKYPFNYSTIFPYNEMVYNNIINPVVEEQVTLDFKPVSLIRTHYDKFNSNALYLPKWIESSVGNADLESNVFFNIYNQNGNIIEMRQQDGSTTSYVYGYANRFPIAVVKNANLATVKSVLGGEVSLTTFSASNPPTDDQVKNFLAPLRSSALLSNSMVTSYTYQPFAGVATITDAKNMISYYEYDQFQRLKYIKDEDKNITKSFDYHFKLDPAGNQKYTHIYTKNVCDIAHYGERMEYTVPKDKYIRETKQMANNEALAEMLANGQANANANGNCFRKGIYVSLCANSSRKVRSGNYEYIYATYSINIYADHYGSIPYKLPVEVSYSHGTAVSNAVVTTSLNLGELEISREYVGPMPAGTVGEIRDGMVSINYSDKYQLLLGCGALMPIEGVDVPDPTPGTSASIKIPAIMFNDIQGLISYSSDPSGTLLQDVTLFSNSQVFNETNLTQNYYADYAQTIPALDGYYTLLETHPTDNKGYKYYYIQNGKVVSTGWSGTAPVIGNPNPGPVANPITISLASNPANPTATCQSNIFTDYYTGGVPVIGSIIYSDPQMSNRIAAGYYFNGNQVFVVNYEGSIFGIQTCQEVASGNLLIIPPPLSMPTQSFITGFSPTKNGFCQILTLPGSPLGEVPAPTEELTLYSLSGPFNLDADASVVGSITPMFYIDQSLTILAPNGFYTLYETDSSHTGYKLYKLENGKMIAQEWCN